MSLRRIVADLVNERGSATVDDLMPELEDEYTREQVKAALKNAKNINLISCGGPIGGRPGVYTPYVDKNKPPARYAGVASVWDLGRASI